MTIEELREKLKQLCENHGHDPEVFHLEADELLIEYINDKEVYELYTSKDRWYS